MTDDKTDTDLTSQIAGGLPFLRRYARALTGSQVSGDNLAAATLEAILSDPTALDDSMEVTPALFKALHRIWLTRQAHPIEEGADFMESAAQKHMANLTGNSREALLLHTIEEFPFSDVARIMDIAQSEVEHLVCVARREMTESVAGRVLIIEDEPVIAMDIESLVADLGHQTTGIARTHAEAVELGASDRPDLILADIRLADNSSGIDAVNDLLEQFGEMPVIFITAYPERLLTGDRPEPAFLITKPYTENQVRSAVSQAMFFSSTATLKA